MPMMHSRATLLAGCAAATLLFTLGQPSALRAADPPTRLAMHDMMPMQQGSPSGGSMGMDDDMSMGSMQGQPPQGGAGMGGVPGMGQPGGAGSPPSAAQPSPQPGHSGGMAMPGMGSTGMPPDTMSRTMSRAGPHATLDRVEGRLAFLRAELRITDQQSAAWEEFGQALRTARQHLVDAREVLQVAGHATHSPTERLEAYERHLAARLDAVRAARSAFGNLYGRLDDAQRQTATELLVPYLESF